MQFISLVTGTSYGTVGTVGVALIGVASGLAIPLPQAAGAIVAGAYFGDKLSPFSDTTNLAPIAAGSYLSTTSATPCGPPAAWLLGLAVYLVIGLTADTGSAGVGNLTDSITTTIESRFAFHWLLLLPAVITLGAAIMKLPVIPSMLGSCAVAVVLAMVFQGSSLVDGVDVMVHAYEIESERSAEPVAQPWRHALDDGRNTTGFLCICVWRHRGSTGMMDIILKYLSRAARTTARLIVVTVASTITTAVLTGS